jgi:hypothetical protein
MSTSANGTHGNLKVTCDVPGCGRVFHGIMPTEVMALRRGVGGLVVNVDPDWAMSEARVRRQARGRGWRTVVDGEGSDLCPREIS